MLFMNDKQNSYGYFSQAGIRSTKVIKLLFCYEKKKSLGKSSHSKNSKSRTSKPDGAKGLISILRSSI